MPNPTLRQGATGAYVVALQMRLNQNNASTPALNRDGQFGPLTRTAVVAFQRKKNLTPDGVVGPMTWGALDQGQAPLIIKDHNLKRIPQPTPDTCWAASTAVMKGSTVPAVIAITKAAGIDTNGGLDNGSGTNDGVQRGRVYGRLHGLNCHAPASWSASGMTSLVNRSPVMFDMLWSVGGYTSGLGSPGHMVVVSAVVSDGTFNGDTMLLRVLDPWRPNVGKDSWVDYNRWMREVPTRTYRLFDWL